MLFYLKVFYIDVRAYHEVILIQGGMKWKSTDFVIDLQIDININKVKVFACERNI